MFGEGISKLWVEEFRPANINDYVFKNPQLKALAEHWISTGELPHLLLHGPAGTGKTSLIHVLLNSIEKIDPSDVMELNMSDEGMESIREKVLPFVQTMPFGAYKIVILEEFEQCSQKGQGSLKRIMEEYSDSARFIMTSNQPNKILPPIRSRLQEVQIESHEFEQFMGKVVQILLSKEVQIGGQEDLDRIEKYVKATYPDFRKCINTLQQNFINGKIVDLNSTTSGSADFKQALVTSIQSGDLASTRKSIVASVRDDEVGEFFTWLYQNVDLWVPSDMDAMSQEMLRMTLILKIRDGIVKDTLVCDRELNMSACLIECQMALIEAMQ